MARATNVVRFLQEKANVPGERLVASGYGEFHPVASNKSSTGRAKNRRIEILLVPIDGAQGDRQERSSAPKRRRRRSRSDHGGVARPHAHRTAFMPVVRRALPGRLRGLSARRHAAGARRGAPQIR